MTCLSYSGISLNWLQPPFCGLCNLAVFAHGILLLTKFPKPWPSSQNCIFPPFGGFKTRIIALNRFSLIPVRTAIFPAGGAWTWLHTPAEQAPWGEHTPPPFLSACWAASSLASPSAFELQTSFCGLASRLSLGFRSGKCRAMPSGYYCNSGYKHKELGKPRLRA